MYFLLKIILSSLIIASVSEVAKRNTFLGALLASFPLTSLLALVWLYYDTRDPGKIIELSYGIFWLVIPSLAFFLILPWMLKSGVKFGWALPIASAATVVVYFFFTYLAKRFGMMI